MWTRFHSVAVFASALGLSCSPDRIAATRAMDQVPDNQNIAAIEQHGLPGQAKVYCANTTSCFAATFTFKDYASDPSFGRPYTVFTAYLQNLQGTFPVDGPDTPLELGLFHFFFDSDEPGTYVDALIQPLTVSTIGNVETGLALSWQHDGPADPGDGNPNYDTWFANGGTEIVGCSLWPGNPVPFYSFRMCPADGFDGWIKVEFILRRFVNFEITRPPVRFRDFRFSFGAAFGPFCTIGGMDPGTCTELAYRRVLKSTP